MVNEEFRAEFSGYIEYDVDEFVSDDGFSNNMDNLLDIIGFVDNIRNKQILTRKKGIKGMISITMEKEKLRDKLWKSYIENMKDNKVETKSDYDRDDVIEQFLSMDVEICNVIKNMTVLLNFKWNYTKYC